MCYVPLSLLVLHENSVKEISRISGVAKEKLKKLLVHKNSVKKHGVIKNVIPERPGTLAPKVHVRPLDYEEIYKEDGKITGDERRDGKAEEKGEVEEEDEERPDLENQTDPEKKLRGDVFCKCHLHIIFKYICIEF